MSTEAGRLGEEAPTLLVRALAALTGQRRDLAARLLVWSLAPLAVVYSIGLKAYLGLYAIGIRRKHRLRCCVVSVGNIVSGGTAKTALTLSLARGLREHGCRVAILSRGFKGRSRRRALVVATEDEVCSTAAEAGDEPYLMATLLPGVPVLVGRDRRCTGAEAMHRFGPDVLLLDDGMQYYQLHRDVEIVLVDAGRPFGNGWTLPAGVLREPPSHLRRADLVVISGRRTPDTERRLRAMSLKAPVHRGSYRPTHLVAAPCGERLDLSVLNGTTVAAFCALAHPEAFEATVESLGARIVRRLRLPDHASPSSDALAGLAAEAVRLQARAVVTSAKDAVKLPAALPSVPFWVLHAEYNVDGMGAILDRIVGLVRDRRSRATA